jgi:hypothetical protein
VIFQQNLCWWLVLSDRCIYPEVMSMNDTLTRQWQDYANYHEDKGNLLIHIFAVPLAWMAALLLLLGIARFSLFGVMFALMTFFVSLTLQNWGHRRESNPPAPFENKVDFLQRILCEQFVNFPRFVLSGGWFQNYSKKG